MAFATEDADPLVMDMLPDWRVHFGERPLSLEIGPGHGGFAVAWASAHPDRALVAIEQRAKFAAEVAARGHRQQLSNLLVLRGDARLMAPRLFAEGSLASIHFHFPDPWWKRRHQRRRLLDGSLSWMLLRLLRPGATLDFRSDVEGYGLAALEELEAVGFENTAGKGRFAERGDDIPSTREKRYLETGQVVYRLRLKRP
jgi:tRNA (guanine-N7-)-methyltransferase